jgi:hypothetical protein
MIWGNGIDVCFSRAKVLFCLASPELLLGQVAKMLVRRKDRRTRLAKLHQFRVRMMGSG